jgi:hypothetical protein
MLDLENKESFGYLALSEQAHNVSDEFFMGEVLTTHSLTNF